MVARFKRRQPIRLVLCGLGMLAEHARTLLHTIRAEEARLGTPT